MSTMDAEVFEAFRSVGVADDKAILAAQALGRRDSDISALKHDMSSVRQDVTTLKQDVTAVKQDVAALKTDVALMKWMLGVVIAMSLTILFRVFHG